MAGPDELVYYEGGREAAMALREPFVPVDHTIVGIVDDVYLAAEREEALYAEIFTGPCDRPEPEMEIET